MADSPKKPANPLSYPKSAEPFSAKLFKQPTAEYRGCPFWAWNTKLNEGQLKRQIDCFEQMGLGGFHMHVRTGLDTEYMGEEFMDLIKSCVDYAGKKNMLACLYDEDRWPSGSAGGSVVKEYPDYKQKHITFSPNYRVNNVDPLAAYEIELDEAGLLKSSRRLKKNESGSNVWYAYLDTNGPDAWFNDQTYIDTLNPEAMAQFIKSTYEIYKDKVGDKFGTVAPCIFTDEPQFYGKGQLSNPRARHDVGIPWTNDLPKTFKKATSIDLLDHLPEIFWDFADGKPSVARYHYHDHTTERFVSAFMDQIARWCNKNNIFLDGHMMEEPTLRQQTNAIGEAMRCYRSMQMPGMDLLVDGIEYNTAKQVTSVARQNGLRGAMSEIYGCTHWYFTFEGHKGCGDWQAALGITFRVHHLAWVSMRGEGKRDYPASINYQSPWYKEYGLVETYFARVGVAMTRGKALTRVAVIHPIESYWLGLGPNGSGEERDVREKAFGDLTYWLVHGLVDFDFISESLLPDQTPGVVGKKLHVGACKYDVVVVPNLRTIRSTTLKVLKDFSKAGGQVIIAGSAPEFIDAKVPKFPPFIENSKSVFWSWQTILSALDPYRDLRILTNQGLPLGRLLYQMREDGDDRYVFICNVERTNPVDALVELKGHWNVEKLDTFSGEESSISTYSKEGWTKFSHKFDGCASLLLRLTPSTSSITNKAPPAIPQQVASKSEAITLHNVTFSEPNVLLLDWAQYKISTSATPEEWAGPTEILRIDNEIRAQVHIPNKGGVIRQPWTIPSARRQVLTELTLRFTFTSSFTVNSACHLALEDASQMKVKVNDTELDTQKSEGYWVDEDITRVHIPPSIIVEGENTVTVSVPFTILTNLERIYILGTFLVDHHHLRSNSSIRPIDRTFAFGDIVNQGLPFYAGNVTYHCFFSVSSPSRVTLRVPNFSTPVLAVHDKLTGKKFGRIAFQPRTLDLGKVEAGPHEISITAYGNRNNSFGHIHLSFDAGFCMPDMWRAGGDWWTDEYRAREFGVLDTPTLDIEELGKDEAQGKNELVRKDEWVMVVKQGKD